MENGLAIIEKTETGAKGFFIDHETIEFARQNAKTTKRIAKAEAAQREANRTRRKAEKAEARRRAYNIHAAGFVLSRLAICGAVVWIGTAGMIHPAICIPVALFNLCAACLRLGAWSGRVSKNG